MTPTGVWQVMRHNCCRFPESWRTTAATQATRTTTYTPYAHKPTYAQVLANPSPTPTLSPTSAKTSTVSPNSTRPSSPATPRTGHLYVSPHSPTYLRFPPSPSFPEWRGRCFKCCKRGHTKAMCRNPMKCGRCWSNGHMGSQCKAEIVPPAATESPKVTPASEPLKGEPSFDDLLTGPLPMEEPMMPEGRPFKLTCYMARDASHFRELERLQQAVDYSKEKRCRSQSWPGGVTS
ncbi:hypothetical protein FCM35_KLT05848 [Carex littledalei]|uniref:CCHC-type domain-containing protein n=1 Tax=Carex littledalei TaxID=544730 RepID=A0A833VJC7_9POAL|nr:hypothetical protein FCM35_KLT05848 [Carex littledalei]